MTKTFTLTGIDEEQKLYEKEQQEKKQKIQIKARRRICGSVAAFCRK